MKLIRCYHVTGVENLDSIFSCGLLPEKFQDGVVWLFKRPEDVTEYLKCAPKTWRGDNAVVECTVPSYQLKRGDWPAWREYYVKHRVLPNRILGAKILTQSLTRARDQGSWGLLVGNRYLGSFRTTVRRGRAVQNE